MAPAYTLRPIDDRDMPFLERLYGSTRAQELAAVPWTDEQKAAFLHQQFTAQHAHYLQNYPGASLDVVERAARAVGRLYVARWAREIRLMDVAVVPEERGRGLGTALVQAVLEEGRRTGKTVTIHVEHLNPARRLYERLGFRPVEDKGMYLFFEWSADEAANKERTSPA